MTHSFSRLDLCEDTTYVYIISRHIRSIQHIRRAQQSIVQYTYRHCSSTSILFFISPYGWTEGGMDRQTDEETHVWLVGWIDGWMMMMVVYVYSIFLKNVQIGSYFQNPSIQIREYTYHTVPYNVPQSHTPYCLTCREFLVFFQSDQPGTQVKIGKISPVVGRQWVGRWDGWLVGWIWLLVVS